MSNMIQKIKDEPKKVLIIKQRQLGDVLMGTASIEALKKAFPNVQIDFLTEKKCAPILANNPHINNLYLIDKKEQNSFLKQILFYKKIAKNNYDTVIALQTLPRVILQVLFSKAKYRLGPYSKAYKNILFTHLVKVNKDYPAIENIEILAPFGIEKPEKITGKLYLTDNDIAKAKKLLSENGFDYADVENKSKKLIVADLTHKDFRRAYPPAHYTKLINYIQEKIPNAYFYFPYAPGEEEQIENCTTDIIAKDRIIIPRECPPLSVSAAITSLANYQMGACSYPRHLAVSFDTPSTSFIGISHTNWDYKSDRHLVVRAGIDCQPCLNHRKCHNPRCMYELLPELIQDKIVEHILKYS